MRADRTRRAWPPLQSASQVRAPMQCNAGTSHGVPIAALLGPPEVVADLDRGTVKVRRAG